MHKITNIKQRRNGNYIDITADIEGVGEYCHMAWLFDGDENYTVDTMGDQYLLKLAGHMDAEFDSAATLEKHLSVAECRAIDAARVPDIRL